MKALLSTIDVIRTSGLPAIAACMFAACCSIEPSVCVKIIWQSASVFAQASSNPFFTACQNVFEGEEWIVKAILTEAASAEPDNASERRRAHSRQQPHHVFPPDVFGAVHGRSQPSYSAFETRTVAVNLFVMSGASSMPRPGPGGTVMNPSRTAGSAVTRSRYHVL